MVLLLLLNNILVLQSSLLAQEVTINEIYINAYQFGLELEEHPIDFECDGINATDNLKKLNPLEYPNLYENLNDSILIQEFFFEREKDEDSIFLRQVVKKFENYYLAAVQLKANKIQSDYDTYISGFLIYPTDSNLIYFLNTGGFIKMSPSPPILDSTYVRSISILDEYYYTMLSYTFDEELDLIFVSSPMYGEDKKYKYETLYNYFDWEDTNFSLKMNPTLEDLFKIYYFKFKSHIAIDCKLKTVQDTLPFWFYNYNSNEYCW